MIGLGGFDFSSLTGWHYGGCCVTSIGLALLALMYIVLNNTRFIRVPEGEEPDAFYRAYRRKKLKERISKPAVGMIVAGVAFTVAGAIVLYFAFRT